MFPNVLSFWIILLSVATGLSNFCDKHDLQLFFEHELAEVVKSNEMKQIIDQFWSWKVILARTLKMNFQCHFYFQIDVC